MNYRIAYLTSKDPFDKRVSSGVYYYQSQSLKKYCGEVYFLGPVKSYLISLIDLFFRILQKFIKRRIYISHNLIISRIYGSVFSKIIKKRHFDFIFADKTSTEIAFLKTQTPLIYSTDGTFALLNNHYPFYKNLSKYSIYAGNKIERNAINNATLVICTSQWAADSVINHYNCSPEKIEVIPRGANIDMIPDKYLVLNKKKDSVCKLIFIGTDWKRKGYDVAYNALNYLREKKIPVILTVVGFIPPKHLTNESVHVIPFLNKNREEDIALYNELMLDADFFIMPTRAEFLGIAFCEAAAYGIPVITSNTGGVAEIIKDGINGYVLDYNAHYKDYGDTIIDIFKDDDHFYQLRRSSRDYFEKRLSWDVWGIKIKKILDKLSAINPEIHSNAIWQKKHNQTNQN